MSADALAVRVVRQWRCLLVVGEWVMYSHECENSGQSRNRT